MTSLPLPSGASARHSVSCQLGPARQCEPAPEPEPECAPTRGREPAAAAPAALEERALSPMLRAVLARALARWSTRWGSASLAALRARAIAALRELESSASSDALALDAERTCTQLERSHEARHGRAALARELADDRAHERARQSSAELVRYQAAWDRRIARLQRAHPQRWHVPGLSDDEVRDAITLRLLELLVATPDGELPRGRPGQPWALCVAQAERAALRRSFRLATTPTDFDGVPVHERGPSQEERCLELEADQRRSLAGDRARQQLGRPQRRWLAAMQHAAAAGGFFQSSDHLNLSAAARLLGKNRSSALRAYRGLEECFQRELERLE